jgi:hypothetical protein
MDEATRWACSCAHRLVCVVRRRGERLGSLDFFDDERDSETHGQRVRECPGCGERLGLLALFAAKPSG